MRRSALTGLSLLALLVGASALAIGAAGDGAHVAQAKRRLAPIGGTLNARGYTVIAVAASGRARSARAGSGRFRLRPPARSVTLHLRAPDGSYAGPVVVGAERHGKRAVLGVRAGAKLGRVKVKRRAGYARPSRVPAAKWIDRRRWARARHGVPIGAGNLGLVRSRHARGPSGDPDLDGIPNSIDVDDDGDRILDAYDRATRRGATTSEAVGLPFRNGDFVDVATSLFPAWSAGEVNVNGGSSEEQIAASEREGGQLAFLWTGIDPGSGELDCGTLSYCSAGGTGRLATSLTARRSESPAYPECCDPDHDGLGSLVQTQPGNNGMLIFHGAAGAEIQPGDVIIARGTVHGSPVEFVSVIGFIYSTYPVLASYDDGQGDSGTFTYPSPRCTPIPEGPPCPVSVRAGPDGHVVLALKFWRPQRPRIGGDPGEGKWMDVGHLEYGITVGTPSSPPSAFCPASSYLALDPNLSSLPPKQTQPDGGGTRFGDQVGDLPSNPANTFSVTLDVTDCLAAAGQTLSSTEAAGATIWASSEPEEGGVRYLAYSGYQLQLEP